MTKVGVPVVASEKGLGALFRGLEVRIYSCLNGYTLRLLANRRQYDALLSSPGVAFVADGIGAHSWLRRQGVSVDRICGRDLLDAALSHVDEPVICVGGREGSSDSLRETFKSWSGRDVSVMTPPMFADFNQLGDYASRIAPAIPSGCLVVMLIRSPLQDLLALELSLRTSGTRFICVGAVVDDLLAQRGAIIKLFSRVRLEWLYRLVITPRRTWPKIALMLSERHVDPHSRYKFFER